MQSIVIHFSSGVGMNVCATIIDLKHVCKDAMLGMGYILVSILSECCSHCEEWLKGGTSLKMSHLVFLQALKDSTA